MNKKLSRRNMLKAVGTIGAAPFLVNAADVAPSSTQNASTPAPPRPPSAEADLVRITAGGTIAVFDKHNGTIYSLSREGDPFGTNFLGNSSNSNASDPHWTGDLVTTVWDLKTPEWIREEPEGYSSYRSSGQWRRETTLDSSDIRETSLSGNSFRVRYAGKSTADRGIRHYALAIEYQLSADGSLLWDIEIINTTDRTLELGEIAFPMRANDDYAGLYHGSSATTVLLAGKMPEIQKQIHEQMVFAHAFTGGHSSYVLLQRPRGDTPFLLFHCLEDTSLECIYKAEGSFRGNWIGTDLLAVHSWATKDLRDWDWNPWVNGHTSLVLEPGEKKTYQFRFAFIGGYSDIQSELAKAGNLGVRILPSMVVQEGTDACVELKSQNDLDDIEIHSDGVDVKARKRKGGATLLTLSFMGRGQKTLKLRYGGNRWTNLHFYCVEDAERLVKARAKFMAERQYYANPADPYHRNHLFLPFDYQRGTRIDENTDVWEVGGTDDPGFGDPLFLAEKNAWLPSREEIERLELYHSECLFKFIQNPNTFEIRASLYWKERYPSSPWGSWSKKRSESTWRTYNYAFVAGIHYAMYRIAANYPDLTKRPAKDYLRMCHQTALKWFTTGPYVHNGLISGSNGVFILEALRAEGWDAEYKSLLTLMQACNENFIHDPYPYSSEIEIDETGQHQVYFFTRYFGREGNSESARRNGEVRTVLKALRGGDQPIWFSYGNDLFAHPDLRGQICCWHSESINGMCLLRAFEDTGDREMLQKGYAGVMSVLRVVLPDGMGFGWFKLDPGVFTYEPPKTFEGGPSMWGFLRAAKSYVVEDEAFGLTGYGCRVAESGEEVTAFPKDGLRKRVLFVAEKINVEATRGQFKSVTLHRARRTLRFEMDDSTGLAKTVLVRIEGLPPGAYILSAGGAEFRLEGKESLDFTLPTEVAAWISLQKA